MNQSAALAASEMTRVTKVRVQIRADSFIYEGYMHLLAETRRIQEVLNDPRPFLSLTEVVIHDRSAATTHHAPYIALNKGAITHVVVLSGDGTGESLEDSPSDDAASAGGRGAGAAPMTVPPSGPRTMPVAPPVRRADPLTQPFPPERVSAADVERDDDDVSDLILDDDGGDDIDPDDLERDAGALIAGAD
jgi:hypothetical protein